MVIFGFLDAIFEVRDGGEGWRRFLLLKSKWAWADAILLLMRPLSLPLAFFTLFSCQRKEKGGWKNTRFSLAAFLPYFHFQYFAKLRSVLAENKIKNNIKNRIK
jgi:hypothetical protein